MMFQGGPFRAYEGTIPENFELIRDDSGAFRVYRDREGVAYESVTSFLGRCDQEGKESIEAWRKAVGHEEADKVSKAAADRGTAIHLACEQYIAGEDWSGISMFYRRDFLTAKKCIDENMTSVFASEHTMYSKKLGLAGTADLICEWNGKLCIGDFKTSGRIKYKDEISSYFLQMAAYSVMLYERYGLKAELGVIIMVVDGDSVPHVFEEQLKPWISVLLAKKAELGSSK